MDNLQRHKNTLYNPNKWRQLLAHLGSKISPKYIPFPSKKEEEENFSTIVLHKHLS